MSDKASSVALADELETLRAQVATLRAENARLLRLLKLSPKEARPPGPAQTGFFEASPGPVHAGSSPAEKVAFFGALFAARTDVYALRWENQRTGKAGWLPAVRGGWRKGVRHADREYLPLTAEVVTAHLSPSVSSSGTGPPPRMCWRVRGRCRPAMARPSSRVRSTPRTNSIRNRPRMVVGVALQWGHKVPRKAALERLTAWGEPDRAQALAAGDPDAAIRAWGRKLDTDSATLGSRFD